MFESKQKSSSKNWWHKKQGNLTCTRDLIFLWILWILPNTQTSSSCMNIYFLIYLFLHVCHWSMFEPGLSRFIILLHVPDPLLLISSPQYLSLLFHTQEEWTKKIRSFFTMEKPIIIISFVDNTLPWHFSLSLVCWLFSFNV